MEDGALRLVYAGALTPTYELDVVLRAVALLGSAHPELPVTLTIYGRGDAEAGLRELAAELGIADRVSLPGRIPIEDVPGAIAAADVGIAPTRLDPFTKMSLSTKVLEYAAMCKPVVASRLPTVERYFGDDTLCLYESGDPESLAAAIVGLDAAPLERAARVERTRRRVDELSWSRQAERYLTVVTRLTRGRGGRRSATPADRDPTPPGRRPEARMR